MFMARVVGFRFMSEVGRKMSVKNCFGVWLKVFIYYDVRCRVG